MTRKNKQPSGTKLNVRYLTELTRLRTQAEWQGRSAIAAAFTALIEGKQAKVNNRIGRSI